ncbi:hypothetical protein ACQY1Q_15015 [Tenacibaculum sp. TC6]|uniref:hypothetical protein n=1 Tax=Tenacibaculum sp. TC6 TaxID=3423223 RepID=UPI003D3689B7
MEEVVFKTLVSNTECIQVDRLIREVIVTNSDLGVTYDEVKESIFKLILYKFIKVKNVASKGNYIQKEQNFYQARELGGVSSWLEKKRAYRYSY